MNSTAKMHIIVLTATVIFLLLSTPPLYATWTGIELDLEGALSRDPYVAGETDTSAAWGLTGRYMLQETWSDFLFELHILAGQMGNTSSSSLILFSNSSPFRVMDLEAVHSRDDRTILFSEVDRLAVTFEGSFVRATLGRQAITWGEAFFFNIEDIFGAFPAIETNRLHKQGIDAVTLNISTGRFSELAAVGIPADNNPGSLALRYSFPAGKGNISLVGGETAGDTLIGGGFAGDFSGTKIYFHSLWTDPDNERSFTQFVLGAERWVDSVTHILAEVYRNGWGTTDRNDYPALLLTERFLSGRVLTLGRWNAAGEISRLFSPLVTGHAALFYNINDGSTLVRVDGGYSLSDNADLRSGFFLGLGDRKQGSVPRSEYGSVPPSFFGELIVNF
ncbi:MAG: hypothetical protein ACC669_04710 [bacterium]